MFDYRRVVCFMINLSFARVDVFLSGLPPATSVDGKHDRQIPVFGV